MTLSGSTCHSGLYRSGNGTVLRHQLAHRGQTRSWVTVWHLVATQVTDINKDSGCRKTMDPDMVLGSGPGQMSLCPSWHCMSPRSECPQWLSRHWISTCSQTAEDLKFSSLVFLLVSSSLDADMMEIVAPCSCRCAFPFMTVNQCKNVFLLLVKYLVKLTMKLLTEGREFLF